MIFRSTSNLYIFLYSNYYFFVTICFIFFGSVFVINLCAYTFSINNLEMCAFLSGFKFEMSKVAYGIINNELLGGPLLFGYNIYSSKFYIYNLLYFQEETIIVHKVLEHINLVYEICVNIYQWFYLLLYIFNMRLLYIYSILNTAYIQFFFSSDFDLLKVFFIEPLDKCYNLYFLDWLCFLLFV